jgi:hypothetical protein
MTNFKLLIIFTATVFVFSGCDLFTNDIKPDEEFTKIIGNEDFSSVFYAEDIAETSDKGFLILGALHNETNPYVWQTPYLVKLDETGAVEWESPVASPYVNPVGNLLQSQNDLVFFAMHETTLETHLLRINQTDGSTELVASFDNITYPVAASQSDDGSYLIQGYDNLARQTVMGNVSVDFALAWSQTYFVNEDAEEILINHVSKNGKQYPFFTGETDSYYFYNGLYNYTFSLVFIDKSSGTFQGVMNGYRYAGAVSSAKQIEGNNYAFSVFTEGENYIFPAGVIDPTSVGSIEGLSEEPVPELKYDAEFAVEEMTINGSESIVFASTTKNNEIKLYFFDSASGELNTYKKIAEKNPMEVQAIMQASDGAIVLLARTFVNGQFSRLYIAKIAEENIF